MNGSLLLPASSVPFLSGCTLVRVTLLDDADEPFYTDISLHVRHVNQPPSFQFKNVTVNENENCRAQEGWDFLGVVNMSTSSPVACHHFISNVAWNLSKGQFPERCLNCGESSLPCNTSLAALSCVH